MPAPIDAASPTRNASQADMRGECRGEYGRERGNGTIHQSRETGLHDLQHEEAAVVPRLPSRSVS